MSQDKVLDGVIDAYRQLVAERYDYDRVVQMYDLPDSFNKEKFNRLKLFFLEQIYPDLERREELNDAFMSLDEYIKKPSMLMSILMDSARIIFKFGRHLPGIMNAGMKAMSSFRKASKIEEEIADIANHLGKKPPFSSKDIESFIRELPKDRILKFIDDNDELFKIIHNRELVEKILQVVDFILGRMRKKMKTYSPEQIAGLEIGREIIQSGDRLFSSLTDDEQEILIAIVKDIEISALEEIYR